MPSVRAAARVCTTISMLPLMLTPSCSGARSAPMSHLWGPVRTCTNLCQATCTPGVVDCNRPDATGIYHPAFQSRSGTFRRGLPHSPARMSLTTASVACVAASDVTHAAHNILHACVQPDGLANSQQRWVASILKTPCRCSSVSCSARMSGCGSRSAAMFASSVGPAGPPAAAT